MILPVFGGFVSLQTAGAATEVAVNFIVTLDDTPTQLYKACSVSIGIHWARWQGNSCIPWTLGVLDVLE